MIDSHETTTMLMPPPPPPVSRASTSSGWQKVVLSRRRSSSRSLNHSSHHDKQQIQSSSFPMTNHQNQSSSSSSSLSHYPSIPIPKHYALNRTVLEAFDAHWKQPQLHDIAIPLGMQFVETALVEIPQHGYYYSVLYTQDRFDSTKNALAVLQLLWEDNHQDEEKDHPTAPLATTDETMKQKKEDLFVVEWHQLAKLARWQYAQQQQEETGGRKERAWDEYEGKRLEVQQILFFKRTEYDAYLQQQEQQGVSLLDRCHSDESSVSSSLVACGDSIASLFCPAAAAAAPPPRSMRATTSMGEDQLMGQMKRGNGSFPTTTCTDQNEFPAHPNKGLVGSIRWRRKKPENLDGFPPTSHHSSSSHAPTSTHSSRSQQQYREEQRDEASESSGKPRLHKPPMSPRGTRRAPNPIHGDASAYPMPRALSTATTTTSSTGGSSTDAASMTALFPTTSDTIGPPVTALERTPSDLKRALFVSGLQVTVARSSTAPPQRMGSNRSLYGQRTPSRSSGNNCGKGDARPYQDPHPDSAPANTQLPGSQPKRISQPAGVSMELLTTMYEEDFEGLCNSGRVHLKQASTYQGRNPGSTNGCTIIAPLLCIHHFHQDNVIPDRGLSDSVIEHVIDDETPNILKAVRTRLGLQDQAFLIPSDAHECLMDQQYLCPEQFLTVCGGNVLEETHLNPLLDVLNQAGPKKVAAIFFFHEHVITILQLRQEKTVKIKRAARSAANRTTEQEVWFDVIDSLPHKSTLRPFGKQQDDEVSLIGGGQHRFFSEPRRGETRQSNFHRNPGHHTQSMNDLPLEQDFQSEEETNDTSLGVWETPEPAARMRCFDRDSLKATLRWYACSVWTQENRDYIDQYEWNESLCDFDPRVFQAFVWTEA